MLWRRRRTMEWWMLEVTKVSALAVIAVGIHQFIRRSGKNYVNDIFRATPAIGRSFLVLADFAYYLIFAAYVLL
jgi:GTP:adenosylcobinamide-phosphate guanylyltransferase